MERKKRFGACRQPCGPALAGSGPEVSHPHEQQLPGPLGRDVVLKVPQDLHGDHPSGSKEGSPCSLVLLFENTEFYDHRHRTEWSTPSWRELGERNNQRERQNGERQNRERQNREPERQRGLLEKLLSKARLLGLCTESFVNKR